MKNPLFKRLPYILKDEIAKYLIIFLFMAGSIGLISGFLVADGSMIKAYNDSFDKYNIEDGHFRLNDSLSKENKKTLEKENVTIYNLNYNEEEVGSSSTIRLFKPRNKVNQVCIMDGKLPKNKNEIAIDRMYADNNNYQVGQTIKVGKKKLKITGLVALSDYSALFSKNSDLMFDAIKFGVGIVSDEGFESFKDAKIYYNYAWTYNEKVDNEVNASNDFLNVLVKNVSGIDDYIPQYANQAIHFTGDDMGGDEAMMTVLLYIIIGILAFVFAITTKNTIESEAPMIGTLRAMGYTKKEMLVQYMTLPILVSLVACIVGNILGYTYFKDVMAGMYYGSYSLPTYQTRWNANAFLLTTVIPAILMFVINAVLISGRLRLSPLRFLRHDFAKKGKSHAVRLPNFRFFSRFRLRILLQNKSSYFTLFLGIIFANILLLFGMMMKPLLSHYQTEAVENMLADYQYILNVPDPIDEDDEYTLMGIVQKLLTPSLKTNTEGVETFALTSLKNIPKNREGESISVYGIQKDSKYVSAELFENGVTISDGYAEKYGMKVGDTLELKEPYEDKTYSFEVKSIYAYPGALAVFLPMDVFCEKFEHPEDYFNGYFSNEPITDLEESYIATKITEDDMTKISRQLNVSMGEMFQLINVFSIVLFMLLIYLLTKLIIEKNTTSISMVKILGYENREILSLYLTATTWVVIVSIGVSLIIASALIRQIYVIMLSEYSGWLTYYIDPAIYGKMYLMGLAAYAVIAVLQFRHIQKIPMDEELKNVE